MLHIAKCAVAYVELWLYVYIYKKKMIIKRIFRIKFKCLRRKNMLS